MKSFTPLHKYLGNITTKLVFLQCLQNSLSVLWFGFCLLLGLSVSWLVVMFGIWFVCLWVGGYVWYLVCVLVSWGLGLVLGLCVCGLVSM